MRKIIGLALGAMLALGARGGLADDKPFANIVAARDAVRYETQLIANRRGALKQGFDFKQMGTAALAAGDDARGAASAFELAVVAHPEDAASWLGLARALLAIKPEEKSSERYELPVQASAAAYRAYERAATKPAKAAALVALSEALKRRSMWRPAIEALKASVNEDDKGEVRQALETLRAEKGFRILEHKVDSDAASPRLCLQFSESLARGAVDFGKFVTLDGKDPQTVTAEGRQLCIDGLSHGKRYELQVRSGLPSSVDEPLHKTAEIAVYVRDRSPGVRISGKAYVLPNRGQQGLPIVTINTNSVGVEVYRVGDRGLSGAVLSGEFQAQLSPYQLTQIREKMGARAYKGVLGVKSQLNADVTTAFPVSEAIGKLEPGVYLLYANVSKSSEPASEGEEEARGGAHASQWFVVSDLGLTALSGSDSVHAFVRGLASAEPALGVEVRLIARNNEVLGTAKTDAKGYAKFAAGLARGTGALAPAILVAQEAKGDYAFLDLTSSAFDLTDRGVKGRETPGPLDAFLFAERGVYRPGEEVHLTALIRDAEGKAAGVPLTMIVSRPDGVEHRRVALTDQGLGGRMLNLALPGSAMTGTWRARIHVDPKSDPIGQAAFLVEDFVPERLDLKLEAATATIAPDTDGAIKVAGKYLYGPPAADLALEGDILVRQSGKDLPGFAKYRFGLSDETFSPLRKPLEDLPHTSAEGLANLAIKLPGLPRTSRLLEAEVLLRLREAGGRTIERTLTVPVDLKEPRIGIKPLFSDDRLGQGETAEFEVIALGADGKQAAVAGLKWELIKLETTYQWYSRDGGWAYETGTHKRRIANGTLDSKTDLPVRLSNKVDWGRYRLEVISAAAAGPATSVGFTSGWFASGETESPEVLEVALDKPSYKAGDTAKLSITAKTAGKALIALIGQGVSSMEMVDVPAGGATVSIAVPKDAMPGVYATAMLYRPMDEKAKRMPSRSIGVRWLAVDQDARTLKVALGLPEKVKSAGQLTVPVQLTGLKPGEEARIVIAAVDAGILNLTRYESPNPEKWFYAQRRLGLEIRDLYGRLIDGMRAERGVLRSGGDGPGGGGMSMTGAPPVETPLALYSGIISVDASGKATVQFQLPDFNGTARVMAVAWTADKLGHAWGEVIVRDPVALTVSAPRFLTLGDEARLQIDVHNVEGGTGSYQLTLDSVPPAGTKGEAARIEARTVEMKAGARSRQETKLKADQIGLVSYQVRVTGPGGIDVKRPLTFDIKVPAGDIKRSMSQQLAGKGGKITLNADLVADLIPERSKVTVTVGPTAKLDVPGLLVALDRYPYGCAEQTVSRALPLLYVNQVAATIGIARDNEIKERIGKAIDRVLEMQDSTGAFGLWGPSNTSLWLTAYVSDFLTRAKETGYIVRPLAMSQALDKLQSSVSYASEFEKGGEDLAYALYVLARNGRAQVGDLRYYVDTRLDRFATPLARSQLGAALAMTGDTPRAETAFRSAMTLLSGKGETEVWRNDYGSKLRDGAGLITLASESGIVKGEAGKLVDVIGAAFSRRAYTSTQEQAWLVMAARALQDEGKDLTLTVNGVSRKGALVTALPAGSLKTQPMTIVNDGEQATDAVVTVSGASLLPEPAAEKGFKIERSVYTLDGKPVDLASAAGGNGTLKQNDRLVVVLKVTPTEDKGGQLLLVDRLPAGLEIENPRLVDSGSVKALDWLKTGIKPVHTEFRDDRFVAAFDLNGRHGNNHGNAAVDSEDQEAEDGTANVIATTSPAAGVQPPIVVAYMVRAVTPGSYVHPAATIEDMYRPDRFARTAAGQLEVTVR